MFSHFTQQTADKFPSSRSWLANRMVCLSLEMFEVTPTTRISCECSLKEALLITITGLTFLPDWSEKGKGTSNKSLCSVFINTCSKLHHPFYFSIFYLKIFLPKPSTLVFL